MKFVKSVILLLLPLISIFLVMGTICAYVVTNDPIPGFGGKLSASLNETTLHVGDTVALTIHPQNYGESDWENILIYAPIPKGFKYLSHVVPNRTMQDYNPSTGIWNVQQMLHGGRGADKELIITLEVLPNAVGTHTIFSVYGVRFISLISVYPTGVNSNPDYYNVVASKQAPGNPRSITVNVANSPIKANFTFTTNYLAVQFNDTSTGKPTSWGWDFGDGITSNEQNPSHTYGKSGTYAVKLIVTNSEGQKSAKSRTIVVKGKPGNGGDKDGDKDGNGGGDNNGNGQDLFDLSGSTKLADVIKNLSASEKNDPLKNLQKGGTGGNTHEVTITDPSNQDNSLGMYILAALLIIGLMVAGYFYGIRREE